MGQARYLRNGTIGAFALVLAGARIIPGDEEGPVLHAATRIIPAKSATKSTGGTGGREVLDKSNAAVRALSARVRPLSHPRALEMAFRSYFAYQAANPDQVRKPLLYFVDYGLPSTEPRGYVFDMKAMSIVDGPFAVAHGRGSSTSQYGIPTRFSNAQGSAASSLGLYLAANTYSFRGRSGGRRYSSLGLRLTGVSGSYNSNALARGVVAHGAPYVTRTRAGRSEGCPAMEQDRARQLLPALADGGMVFLFAPDARWMSGDPWIEASAE